MIALERFESGWVAVLLMFCGCSVSSFAQEQTTTGPPNAVVVTMTIKDTSQPRPSILFCSPQGATNGWIDVNYLKQLYSHGFEVDYTDSLLDILPKEKGSDGIYHPKIDINNYNVVVLYATPETVVQWLGYNPFAPEGSDNQAFLKTVRNYVDRGGGVFLHPREMNITKQMLYDIAHPWGVDLPMETIENGNSSNIANLRHASFPVPIAYTNNVNHTGVAAEITNGINTIWYPLGAPMLQWFAEASGPLALASNWTTLISADGAAYTQAIDYAKCGGLAANKPNQPGTAPRSELGKPGIYAPPLMAVRATLSGDGENGPGRAAMLNQWPQYTVGSGLGWIFDSQVLSAGSGGRLSDMGVLLENTYRWLSQPSLKAGTVGGYLTASSKLLPPNMAAISPETTAQLKYNASWDSLQKQWSEPPTYTPAYRGLIGAQTKYSGGSSTVAEYAQAAREGGIKFVVFLEDFNHLSAADFASLKQECLNNSGSELLLVPGFKIQANIGDHMFFIGPEAEYLSDEVVILVNGQKTFNLQPPDPNNIGKYTGYAGHGFLWLYRYMNSKANLGFYNFSASPATDSVTSLHSTLHISDLRDCGMAALCYYRNNKVVEDFTINSNLAEYRTCVQSTLPPVPISVNEVASVAEFNKEIASGHALTYVRVGKIINIFKEGLSYDRFWSCRTFVSDGPVIHEWQGTSRASTYGAEEFVTQAAIMASRVEVSSNSPLARLDIYNGRDLFRSITPRSGVGLPVAQWWTVLMLNNSVQKSLILEVTDEANRRAVSYARLCWKDGGREVRFCSDRISDCGVNALIGKGSYRTLVNCVRPLSSYVAGYTWDGGPTGNAPLVLFEDGRPSLQTDRNDLTKSGAEDVKQFQQTPLLEFSDEGAVATTSENNRLFDSRVEIVANPPNTWGPLTDSPKLLSANLRYREYLSPTIGPQATNWAAYSERSGVSCSIFQSEIEFKQNMNVSKLSLSHGWNDPAPAGTNVAYSQIVDGHPVVIHDIVTSSHLYMDLNAGDWFAFFSADAFDNHVFIVRGEPIKVDAMAYNNGKLGVNIDAAFDNSNVVAGERHVWELLSLGVPMNLAVHDVNGIANLLAYLNAPDGLAIGHGSRVPSPGLLEVSPIDGYVEVSVNKPVKDNHLTLPLRVSGMNRRWTVGLLQKTGYVKGFYGTGENRYREVGLDADGRAYVPLYPNLAPQTHTIVGHPVTASGTNAAQLYIQVTHLYDSPAYWHVSANNPTQQAITATFHNAFQLPGLNFSDRKVTLLPGEYRVLLSQ